MHILITGAAGMLGTKLVNRLVQDGGISALTLADIFKPQVPESFTGSAICHAVDIADPDTATLLVKDRPDVIFHLAAIVSGEAEQNFLKGNRINLDGTRYLLERIRELSDEEAYYPRFVFSSSVAVFGTPLPDVIDDDQRLTPLSSYGTQKAMGELMVADYSRKGFLDGISLRLPTISVRPGKPNKAASSFFSGIIREPLNGQEAILPVSRSLRHWFQSPRAAVHNLAHATRVDLKKVPEDRAMNLPGCTATVSDMIGALKNVAGPEAVAHIRDEPDDVIRRVVGGWPKAFNPQRALNLGFRGERNFEEIIRVYLEDDMVHT